MAPSKQTGGVQSRPECAYSKQLHWAVSCLSLPSLSFLKAGTKFAEKALKLLICWRLLSRMSGITAAVSRIGQFANNQNTFDWALTVDWVV